MTASADTGLPTPNPVPSPKPQSLMKAAGLMALLLLFSKALGFARDWFILTVYGASLATDAYFAAVQLPQASIVLLGGLGGPFYTATIAILSRYLAKNSVGEETPTEEAKRLAATFTTATSGVFLALSVLAFVFAEPVMKLLLGGAHNPALIQASAMQLRIMAPVIWIGSLVGIFYGALNMLQVYIWPALSPTALSVAMIATLWIFPADEGGLLLAWSTLAGAILQFILQVPEYLHKGFKLKPTLSALKTPAMQDLAHLLFPAMLGTTIGQLTTFVDMAFASHLPVGGWSAISLSNRLMQLPIGVLQTALLVPLFPRLAKLALEGDDVALGRNVEQGVGALWWIVLPIMIFLFFFTEPIIRIVFEHGSFDRQDTLLVSWAVLFQLLSMIPYFFRDTMTRVFYAYGDSRTPLMVGLAAIVLKAALNWLFVFVIPGFSVGGITLSITLVTIFNALLLGTLVKRHTRAIPYLAMARTLGKLVVASLPAVGVCWGLSPLLADPLLPLWLDLIIILGVMGGVYFLSSMVLQVQEARLVSDQLLRRIGRVR